ncbi:MAG: DUF5597 domain-containing protein [Terriglobales bacterium]
MSGASAGLRKAAMAVAVAMMGLGLSPMARAASGSGMPHLAKRHGATQFVVDGEPFLVRGGELENSSASSLKFMDAEVWPKAVAMHFNTVLAPVYWDLVEPREGVFDFSTVDGLIAGARARHMKLVLLWFGSWKNSMSCYVPGWVKVNQARFPRAESSDGQQLEILSAVSRNNLDADATAFAALMRHLKTVDGTEHTVILVQVENEVGMILTPGGDQPRDYSPEADAAFRGPVPAALTDYLKRHVAALAPWLRRAWEAHGAKAGASWAATFGPGPGADDLFTAWTEARYTGQVAAAGKRAYGLPMYVNAALLGPGNPVGSFPNGAPLPELFDVWRAAAPAIDFFSPDVYFPNFKRWADAYAQPGNPLFVPESGRSSAANLGANALYAYGQLNAMGYSVYAPEFLPPDQEKTLGDAYAVIRQITPLILEKQGTGAMTGIRTPMGADGKDDVSPQTFELAGYNFTAHFTVQAYRPGMGPGRPLPGAHGALVMEMAPSEFLVAGTGMYLTFAGAGRPDARTGMAPQAGIEWIQEGTFVDGKWTPGRELNGDDDNQGRWLQLPANQFVIRMVKLYHYQ